MSQVRNPDRTDYIVLGLVSGCGLTFEILLLRVFSYSQWHHFASVAISLALLGFGIAGTCLTLIYRKGWHTGDRLHLAGILTGAVGMLVAYALPHLLRTRPLFAAWDLHELVKLLVLDFVCLIPFFGIALSIGQVFIRWPGATRRLYCTNLVGSGIGALLPLILLPFLYLEHVLLFTPMLLFIAAALYAFTHRTSRIAGSLSVAAALLILAWMTTGPQKLPVSDFKQLSYFLDLPDARIVERQPGLNNEVTIIESDAIRLAAGLSLRWMNAVASQDIIIIGSDAAIPLAKSGTDQGFHAARLGQLPLLLRPHGEIAVVGISDWLFPGQFNDRSSLWIHADSTVFDIYRSRGLLNDIKTEVIGYRSFIAKTQARYSLIYLNEAYATKDSVSEDYMLTQEGIQSAFNRLTASGILALPIRFEYPPRYAAKLIRSLYECLLERAVADPTMCIAIVRSMQDVLLMASPMPLSEKDVDSIRSFSSQWNFDLCALPGLAQQETNKYHMLDQPVLFETVAALRDERKEMPVPATWFSMQLPDDSKPYFWRSVEWDMAFDLWQTIGRQSLVWMDWGILALIVKLILSAILAALLIILPLGCLPVADNSKSRFSVFLYFAALGLGFLILEMVVFQRSLLYLPNSIVAATVVFTVFLIGAGIGSITTPRANQPRAHKSIFIPILLAAVLAYAALYPCKNLLLKSSPVMLAVLVACIIAPLAWSLGRAFPWGLRQLDQHREWIPWAWAINGFFSVMAAPSAALLSIQYGQSVTWLTAAGCYLLAACVARSWLTGR